MNNNKFIILALFLIIPFVAFGQNNEWEDVFYDTIMISHKEYTDEKSFFVTDTIISKPFAPVNFLVGTTILANTFSQISAYFDYGLDFDKVIPNSNCGEIEEEYFSSPITNIEKSDNLLIIEFKYGKGCMQDILCDFGIIDDEILDLKYIAYGAYGESGSCFSLTYFIRINKKYASKDFSDIKYVMLNGNKKTLRKLENFSK